MSKYYVCETGNQLAVVVTAEKDLQDITGEKELPGGHYSIHEDENGETGKKVYEYDGNEDGSPQKVTGILEAGKEYWLVEDLSPTGYAYTEAVKFKVSTDGSTDYVVMKDKETHVNIRKENTSGTLLDKAVLQILDSSGAEVLEFETAAGEVYSISGVLIAGKEYTLREKTAPSGYRKAADITFTVGLDGAIDTITMIDRKITGSGGSTTTTTTKKDTPEHKVGRITAKYEHNLDNSGRMRIPFSGVPKTGDSSISTEVLIMIILFTLSVCIFSGRYLYKERRKKREQEEEEK